MNHRARIAYLAIASSLLSMTTLVPVAQAKHRTKTTGSTTTTTTTSSSGTTSTTSSTTSTTPTTAPKTILGFYTVYYTGDNASYNSLYNYSTQMNALSTMTFNASADGTVSGTAPSNGLTLAASDGIKSFAAVTNQTNGAFDGSLAHSIFSNPTIEQTVESNLLNVVKSSGYQGADIDFEDLYPTDRTAFTAFISQLSSLFHQNGYKIMVSVAAKTYDDTIGAWDGAFDYSGLGAVADDIQIMSYDEHGPWGASGPVASFPWVQSVVQYAVSAIPSTKILLGLAAYGYDWNLTTNTGNKAVAWKNIPSLISSTGATPMWDSTSQSPYFHYTASDGSSHVVWYENPTSIEDKVNLVNQYNLGGVSMWRMGLEDSSFWSAIHTSLGQ